MSALVLALCGAVMVVLISPAMVGALIGWADRISRALALLVYGAEAGAGDD